jgi:hypothetical protein
MVGLTVIVIELLVTVGVNTQGALLVSSQVTTSPLFKLVVVYVGALDTGNPLTFQV